MKIITMFNALGKKWGQATFRKIVFWGLGRLCDLRKFKKYVNRTGHFHFALRLEMFLFDISSITLLIGDGV